MAVTKKSFKSNDGGKTRSSMSEKGIKKVKGQNFYRDAKKAAKVKMLTGGKPVYDRDGKIKEAAAFQKGEEDAKPGRVQPDRRWFGESVESGPPILEMKNLWTHRKHSGYLPKGS
jgi:nuclear GTP-binding protein